MDRILIGQTLWCKNGETVIVKDISSEEIIVKYRGKTYTRSISIIGIRLFNYNTRTGNPLQNKECNNCMVQRSGDCFGKKFANAMIPFQHITVKRKDTGLHTVMQPLLEWE